MIDDEQVSIYILYSNDDDDMMSITMMVTILLMLLITDDTLTNRLMKREEIKTISLFMLTLYQSTSNRKRHWLLFMTYVTRQD